MTQRPWLAWLIFAVCLALVAGAMGWASLAVVRLEQAQEAAHHEADFEENVRLALWRMDSALTPMIGQESMRPHFIYDSFYPSNQMFTCQPEGKTIDGLVPSPLLLETPQHVLLHFQYDSEGKIASPQVPTGAHFNLAKDGCTSETNIGSAAARLAELQTRVSWDALLAAMGHEKPEPGIAQETPREREAFRRSPPQQMARQSVLAQVIKNDQEFTARSGNVQAAIENYNAAQTQLGSAPGANENDAIMKFYWVGNTLVLARKVVFLGEEILQGCWIDWPSLKRWLVESVEDLLPLADLEPARSDSAERRSRLLATLPAALVVGPMSFEPSSASSPLRLSLVAAWACVLVAAAAVAMLLLGIIKLSERRAAFVSAVTHELRTPLTTFRMYSEILSKGMLTDEEKRRRYLTTLCTEADRLGHLVENVLAFARLERRGSDGARIGSVGLADLLERVRSRLHDRSEQAGMQLEIEARAEDAALSVKADPAAVEQIVFNLVDNACKYARGAQDPRLLVTTSADGRFAVVRVRDHGPGISEAAARRLFRPFSKSASDAANSAPGVGLGLALSRRLARSMGGDLRYDASVTDGACFELRLPAA